MNIATHFFFFEKLRFLNLLQFNVNSDDIQDDIKRQKNRTTRSTMKVGWTMAPNGSLDRRGRSMPGPVLGSGPLPPNATTNLRNPRSDSVVKYYYWYEVEAIFFDINVQNILYFFLCVFIF